MNEAIEQVLAPHVEPEWARAMVLELRVQGVSGERIGAALAEVEAHCTDSGQSARASFGEPAAYARALGLPADSGQGSAAIGRATAPIVVQVIGMSAVLAAAPGLRDAGQVELRLGHIVWLLLFLGVTAVLVLASTAALRTVVEHPVAATLAGVAILLVLVLPSVLLPGVIAHLAAWPVFVLGVACLLGGVLWALRGPADAAEDEITSPVPGARQPRSAFPAWVVVLLVPAFTVIGAVALVVLA